MYALVTFGARESTSERFSLIHNSRVRTRVGTHWDRSPVVGRTADALFQECPEHVTVRRFIFTHVARFANLSTVQNKCVVKFNSSEIFYNVRQSVYLLKLTLSHLRRC